jgi:toxin secretion/phage lysis holin
MGEYNSYLIGIVATIGTAITSALGGWDKGLDFLFWAIIADLAFGLIRSLKEKRFSTVEGLYGIATKMCYFLFIILAHQMDIWLGKEVVRNFALIALCSTEAISATKNAKAIGIPVPQVIIDVLTGIYKRDKMNNKGGSTDAKL